MLPLPDRQALEVRRLVDRFGTAGGVGVKTPVPATLTTLAIFFKRAEPTTSFGVLVTPSWLTTVAVTSRGLDNFTLSFGTAAPSGATVDWCLIRSED